MFHLKTEPKTAFKAVLEDLEEWGPGIEKVSWDHSGSITQSMGVGSFRQCTFEGDLLHEDIRYYKENEIYAYSVDMEKSNVSFPIHNHLGVFIVEDNGKGGSLITWRMYFDGNFIGAGPLVTMMVNRMVVKKGINNLVDIYGGSRIDVI